MALAGLSSLMESWSHNLFSSVFPVVCRVYYLWVLLLYIMDLACKTMQVKQQERQQYEHKHLHTAKDIEAGCGIN